MSFYEKFSYILIFCELWYNKTAKPMAHEDNKGQSQSFIIMVEIEIF